MKFQLILIVALITALFSNAYATMINRDGTISTKFKGEYSIIVSCVRNGYFESHGMYFMCVRLSDV